MKGSTRVIALAVASTCVAWLSACDSASDEASARPSTPGGVPTFQVDPTWPLEMPNDWIMGSVTAVFVDARDHVWVTHLPETLTPEETSAVQDPPIGMCCVPAPVVVEFDAEGRVVQGWGDPSTQDVSDPRDSRLIRLWADLRARNPVFYRLPSRSQWRVIEVFDCLPWRVRVGF